MENKNSYTSDFITPRDDETFRLESAGRSDLRNSPKQTPNTLRSRLSQMVSRNNNVIEKNKSTFQSTHSNFNVDFNSMDVNSFNELKILLAEKIDVIEKLQQNLLEEKNKNAENEAKIAKYESGIKSRTSSIGNDQVSSLENLLTEKNALIEELNVKMSEMDVKCKNYDNINDQYSDILKQYRQLELDNIELEKQLKAKPEKDVKGADKTLDQYREQLQEANYNLRLKENECGLLKEKNTELKTEVQLLETRLAASTNPDYFDRLTRRIQELMESQEKHTMETDQLKSVIAEKTKKIEQLISKGQSLNIDLENEVYEDDNVCDIENTGYSTGENVHYFNMESGRVIEKSNSQEIKGHLLKGFIGNKFKINDIANKYNMGFNYSPLVNFFLALFIIRTLIWL